MDPGDVLNEVARQGVHGGKEATVNGVRYQWTGKRIFFRSPRGEEVNVTLDSPDSLLISVDNLVVASVTDTRDIQDPRLRELVETAMRAVRSAIPAWAAEKAAERTAAERARDDL